MEKDILSEKQLNEVAPLVAALVGALVGMGLEKNKAKKAAQQAVAKADGAGADANVDPGLAKGQTGIAAPDAKPTAPPTGRSYNDVMKMGSKGQGVKRLQVKLGMRQADGIFGPATAKAVKTFQKNQGLKVDGIVGPNTKKAIEKLAKAGSFKDPNAMKIRTDFSVDHTGNPIKEEITVSGSAEELARMMQLAGAPGAKMLEPMDINQPEPEMDSPCGGGSEPSMGDMVSMMRSEDDDQGAMGDEYDDEPSAPDEMYINDVSASIPSGNDLHKSKKSYAKASGGDNPMNLESIKDQLYAALTDKMTEGRGRGRGKKMKDDINTTEGRGRGRGKKMKMKDAIDVKTTEGRGKGKGRGRGKG
jgi:hypothetical protein|tara:strand:- start:8 stop:1087 length:1080 start_codon:yes stop_codon:yes gene_type:complete